MQSPPQNTSGTSGGTSSGTSGVADELKADVQQVASTAGDRLHGEINARKGTAATQARSVSSAIDRAAGELDDSPQWIRSAFSQAARQVQKFADTLENRDSRQIMSDVRSFARDYPGTFLAGCAAAGFAAARVFKAGASDGSSPQQGSFEQYEAPGFETYAPGVAPPGGFQSASGAGFGSAADSTIPPTTRGEFV